MTIEADWAFFQDEIAGRSTGEFLHSPHAVEAVASRTRENAATTCEAIRDALVRARDIDVATLVRRAPRIALTNCHLANYSGSELWTEEVANYLVRWGVPLIVFSPVLGAISERMERAGVVVTDDPQRLADFAPDLVHINHHAAIEHALSGLSARPRFINMIHGLLPAPGLPAREGMNAYWSVALHATAKITMLTPCPWADVRHIPNWFDETQISRRQSGLGKRALLFSSKTSSDQRERLSQMLGKIGYTLDHIGYGGVPSANPAELLGQYDLVFAVARSAIEALASGSRVILWDSGAIGPMVTEDNFWTCVASNFSMAACVLPYRFVTDEDAREWLVAQEKQPGHGATEMALANLRLNNVARLLVEGYAEVLSA